MSQFISAYNVRYVQLGVGDANWNAHGLGQQKYKILVNILSARVAPNAIELQTQSNSGLFALGTYILGLYETLYYIPCSSF